MITSDAIAPVSKNDRDKTARSNKLYICWTTNSDVNGFQGRMCIMASHWRSGNGWLVQWPTLTDNATQYYKKREIPINHLFGCTAHTTYKRLSQNNNKNTDGTEKVFAMQALLGGKLKEITSIEIKSHVRYPVCLFQHTGKSKFGIFINGWLVSLVCQHNGFLMFTNK